MKPACRSLIAVSVAAALAGAACKSAQSKSEAKADLEDTRPSGGQTWTEARIISFNNYAEDLLNYTGDERTTYNEAALQLKTSFERIGVTRYDPLSTYTIMLGNYGECFGDNRSDYGIWWNSHRDAIKKQIEEVAFFVRDFHYIMFGKAKGAFSFREVIICPEAKVGSKMLLEGYKLYIGIPYSTLGYYVPIPAQGSSQPTLRSLWNDGYPLGVGNAGQGVLASIRALFSSEEKAKAAMKALWTLFNPLAPVRQGLRRLLHEQRDSILPALGRLLPSLESVTPEARAGLFELAGVQDSDADDAVLKRAGDNWRCMLERPDAMAEVENDAMAMVQDNIKRTTVRNDVEAGLVAVVNHHDVGVLVSIGTGSYDRFLDASVIQEFNVESRVRAGLVAVSTSDNISIDARFLRSSGKALRSGTFTKALEAARRGESLCGS